MFDKFLKKKDEEPDKKEQIDSKSKQKNDLFTLLEENPETELETPQITTSKKPEPKKESPKKDLDSVESSVTPKNEEKPKTVTIKKEESKEEYSQDSANKTTESKITIPKIHSKEDIPVSSIKGDKSQLLLLEVEKLPDKTIKPIVDFNESCLFYPILSKIGVEPDDVEFLDELVAEGSLEKRVFEKLIICPTHPDAYSSSVRLYCPKCNSLNVDKLNLYEHKRCGFITESTDFDFSNPKNTVCPSCKKPIEDFKREIRIPAMWHQCLDCNEKFDNAIIKLYCRQYEHDFETGSGQFITTYSYKLKDFDGPMTSNDEQMQKDLEKLFGEFNFTTEIKANVKGKTGNPHKIPVFAKNKSSGNTVAIFVNRSLENVSLSDINAILVPILDIGPSHTLLLTTAGVGEGVRPIAKQYGIEIISDPDMNRMIDNVEKFVSENYSRNGEM